MSETIPYYWVNPSNVRDLRDEHLHGPYSTEREAAQSAIRLGGGVILKEVSRVALAVTRSGAEEEQK